MIVYRYGDYQVAKRGKEFFAIYADGSESQPQRTLNKAIDMLPAFGRLGRK